MFLLYVMAILGLFGPLAPVVVIGAIWLGLAYGGWPGRVVVIAAIGGCGISLALQIINAGSDGTALGVVVLLITLAIAVGLWNLRVGPLRGR